MKNTNLFKIEQNINPIDFSNHNVVFCDSLQALEWAYQNGLPKSAIIKSGAPAMLWCESDNIFHIEARWTIKEIERFQSTIQELTEGIFDATLSVDGVDRELALTISNSVLHFQDVIYQAACLEESDFSDSRLFIYVSGEVGPSGNIMNYPWDKLLSSNKKFSIINYTLRKDNWKVLTTEGVSYWKRLKVAGIESITYRLAVKLMEKIPDWFFSKEIFMPNENELNIEIASSLVLHGVKISKIQINPVPNDKNIVSSIDVAMIFEIILPIMRKRIEDWVTPSALKVTMSLFESNLVKQLNRFQLLADEWDKVILKSNKIKRAVLVNSPGNVSGQALSCVCRKNGIPLISSQHGITIEISKMHDMLQVGFDNSVSDVIFSYNSKIVDVEKSTHFDKSKYHVVGMPMRIIRMKYAKKIDKLTPSIVYISTNLYEMGFSLLSSKTDYNRAKDEQKLIEKVLSKLPHKVLYKTYPEDNRRYADVDPVLNNIKSFKNIDLFSDKIDMRYLIFRHRVFITTCATSTLAWPVMSGKPTIFINQKENSPLTKNAHQKLSKGLFVFDDDAVNFYGDLRGFLSKPIDEIEKLWQEKRSAREEMIKEYFSQYDGGAGKRAARTILKEYLT